MKNRPQKVSDLVDYLSKMSDLDKNKALYNLLYWQMIEIGEDVHARYDDDDDKIVEICWSSCGESIVET